MLVRDERYGAFCPVECGRCGAGVVAAKFSPQHTSVQWSAEAVRACVEFSAAWALGRGDELEALTLARPSLEDVYLDLVGEAGDGEPGNGESVNGDSGTGEPGRAAGAAGAAARGRAAS